jgi:hypothetical protein
MDYKCLTKAFIFMTAFTLTFTGFAYVKYVNINDDGMSTPTVEVFQTEDEDGNLRYTTLKG